MNQKQIESKTQDIEDPREEGLDETACYCSHDELVAYIRAMKGG